MVKQYSLWKGDERAPLKQKSQTVFPKTHEELIKFYAEQVLAELRRREAKIEDRPMLLAVILAGTCSPGSKTYNEILDALADLENDVS